MTNYEYCFYCAKKVKKIKLSCSHEICFNCMYNLKDLKCPICNIKIEFPKIGSPKESYIQKKSNEITDYLKLYEEDPGLSNYLIQKFNEQQKKPPKIRKQAKWWCIP